MVSIGFADWLKDQEMPCGLAQILEDVATACREVARQVRLAPLVGLTGSAGAINVQGEVQKQLDIVANEVFINALADNKYVAALVSEEVEDVIQNAAADKQAKYAVCFDPLDGSSNIEINGTIGSIFSILNMQGDTRPVDVSSVLEAYDHQVAAGYVLYGPATLLVLTTGKTVAMFALNSACKEFRLVQDAITIPKAASEFAINIAHRRFWDAAVTSYIDECLLGEQGPRNKPFNMRWAGAMVADVHRLFVRGGIFIYPALATPGGAEGKLRLLYEANPMAMLVKVAGGHAISGNKPFDDVRPKNLHQRVPLALGSQEEVEHLLSKSQGDIA